jgi:diacylglycerol kinase (ATP)
MDSGKLESPHKGKTGFRRVWNALFYSFSGLRAALAHEDAFRQEVMLIGSVLLVLIVELLNSAVEAAVDRISLDHHLLAKRAKDIGSAAVFISLLNVAAVWMLVLFG